MSPPTLAIATHQLRQHGGMERYVLDLITGLTQRQHAIKVYAAKADAHLPQYTQVQWIAIPQKRIVKKLRPFFFARQVDHMRLADEPLIACSPCYHADLLVCGWTHGGYVRAQGKRASFIQKLNIYLDKHALHSAKRIVAHSQFIRQELIELYDVAADKIDVIYPPVDVAQFYPDVQAARHTRAHYGFQDHETIFLFPSTGHKRKGLYQLAQFFEHTHLPIKLVVAGSPLPRRMKNVVELGYCHNMPDLYRAADYTIMASHYEPFGLVGIESVLCGTRVVLSDNMACTEVLYPDAGFFFSLNHIQTMSHAIDQAVQLKQAQQHRISQPFDMIRYNPTLAHHVQHIKQLLSIQS